MIASSAGQVSPYVHEPTYDYYFDSFGNRKRPLRQLKQDLENATLDWRGQLVQTQEARHDMEFAPTDILRAAAEQRWIMMTTAQEALRAAKVVRTRRYQRENRNARELKAELKIEQAKKKNLAKLKTLKAQGKSRRDNGTRRLLLETTTSSLWGDGYDDKADW